MNSEKYRIGNCGLLNEADRTMYEKKDTVSHSLIDPTRTHLNYNLCPHKQYTRSQIQAINERIRGKKLASNGIAWASSILTVPKDYEGDLEAFFEEGYKQLKKLYHLKDEDIISAYVHLDETTPHMHFYYIPVWRDKGDIEKVCGVNYNKIMSKTMYLTQHKKLQEALEKNLGVPCHIRNNETIGYDVQKLNQEQKKASMELVGVKKELEGVKKELKEKSEQVTKLECEITSVMYDKQEVEKELEGMKAKVSKIKEWMQSVTERFGDLVSKAAKIEFPFIKQKRVDAIIKHGQEEKEGIEAFLSQEDDLPTQIPIDELGRLVGRNQQLENYIEEEMER